MRIIPAIDIINGKCVRLTKGDYSTLRTYRDNPLDVAREFEEQGIQYLHLVDLDGAKSNHIVNHHVLEEIATKTSLQIDFGGGIKSDEDVRIAFGSGAAQITGGSIAQQQPALFREWLATYGAEKIILGADSHHRKIATNGWQQESQEDVVDFISAYEREGVHYVICTDIARDGMLEGPSTGLYREIIAHTNLALIASGGITSLDDLRLLQQIGCEGAIIGKAIYEGKIGLKDLRHFIESNRSFSPSSETKAER